MTNKLIKHSAAIQLSGSLTLGQRQCYNAMLKNALPWMERGEDHLVQVRALEELLHKRGSRNQRWLIETVESLRDVSVRYNVLGKDRDNREVWEMHSGLLAEVGVNKARELVRYSFPNTLVDLLAAPSMYAKISLDNQARFRSHYGLALYEFYLDILGGKRNAVDYTFWISDLRRLLCVEDKYSDYRRLADKLIKPAHREICDNTELDVEVTEVFRENRRVVALALHIERARQANTDILERDSINDGHVRRGLDAYYPKETTALLLNRYPSDYIQAQLDYVERQKAHHPINKPPAYLRSALQADYAGYNTRKKQASVPEKTPASRSQRAPTPYDEAEAAERQRKALEKRWREHCNAVAQQRYSDCDEDQQAALQQRFKESSIYQDNRSLHRNRTDSGLYHHFWMMFLTQELCPEPHFHDIDTFAAYEQEGQGETLDAADEAAD